LIPDANPRLLVEVGGMQHPGGHEELVRKVAALGLAWAEAWERVRAEAADALAALRDELHVGRGCGLNVARGT
jgi:hypothetical protein